ncbi:MAG: hypothetical protein EXR49_07825 [Dehalococcoidia bacterium]|nr:hypothetical protein [Dehalococcoidia bacterium]
MPHTQSNTLVNPAAIPTPTLIAAVLGILAGLLASALLAVPLRELPGRAGDWSPLAATITATGLALRLALSRQRELLTPLHILHILPISPVLPVLPQTPPAPPAAQAAPGHQRHH